MKVSKWGIPHVHAHSEAGAFFLSRDLPSLVAAMDAVPELERFGNKKIWYLRPEIFFTLDLLLDEYKSKIGYIIGKGPSLDKLTKNDFSDPGVVLCCNDSVHHILSLELEQSIYLVQCDPDAGTIDVSIPVIIALTCTQLYLEKDEVYYGGKKEFGDMYISPVGCLAIASAKLFGCNKLIMMGFDGAFGGSCEYADIIGYSSTKHSRGMQSRRFKDHKSRLLKNIGDIPYTIFKIDEEISLSSDDKLQQSPHSQTQQNEHEHSQSQAENTNTSDSPSETEPSHHEKQTNHSETEQ